MGDVMKAMLLAGVLLIVLGVLSLSFQGIPYKADREAIRVGPLQATAETTRKIPLPPALGGIAVAGGTVLLLCGAFGLQRK